MEYLGYIPNFKNIKDLYKSHLFKCDMLNCDSWVIVREYNDRTCKLYSISDSKKILEGIKKRKE